MNYPFSALVGQPKLKQALLLCAVNPGIGGVLVRGDKGTAKSTAVRGLAAVMPSIQRVAGSRFNSLPDEPFDECEACQQSDWRVEEIAVPFVNLPLGATEDRVLGSLDLEGVLVERKKKLLPGLLASAHQGILYIDEVNLLADHLVDSLLDVAAMGVNTVQRDGLSISHPARFMLIGTMNPEEGSLRPQFLDRFGLVVDVTAPRDVTERTEVVRRRMAFEADPESFARQWSGEQQLLQAQLQKARLLLPSVRLADGLLTMISQLCTDLHVASLRADLVMYKTAKTLAALAGRLDVTPDDIRQAAELALPHRQRKKNAQSNLTDTTKLDELLQQNLPRQHSGPAQPQSDSSAPSSLSSGAETPDSGVPPSATEPQLEQTFGALPDVASPTLVTEPIKQRTSTPEGQRSQMSDTVRGNALRAVRDPAPTDLAVTATLQSSFMRSADDWTLTRDDLHQTIRTGKTGNLILFVVDASGSMAAHRRMEAVKGCILSLLQDAYQHRDSVGMIAFKGVEAQVLLPPTRDVEQAEQALHQLPTGGRTPLPHALQLAGEVIQQTTQSGNAKPFLVLLSDGKANVPLPGGGDAWQQTIQLATQLREQQISALVLDTDTDYLRLGRTADLAIALGADCLSLDDLSSQTLTETVKSQVYPN
ncbi:magnesium chelatase subunit D family protein [Spirosoma sp. KUDC1026]|uniref:magnesium chelatase subunit D family protein n=1 Tax=Spirosoma sp. KUDC1026 TaxID=2745947 RepID=UPI00159BCE8C|nr:magnesium chelatase subunit D family protein [Spirosoma sp. KUDC1026]QKZ15393.1 magnesium chelatase subunit D family protein [Spirosoma sp. KUDC1026]